MDKNSKEILVRYTSENWNDAQKKYSTIKKELLSIVKCITKFEGDLVKQRAMAKKPMNRLPKKETKSTTTKSSVDFEKFNPIQEFENDDTTYDIQYYQDAIFAQNRTKEDLKYPYIILGYINYFPVNENLKGLAPIHEAQSYLNKELLPIYGKKSREYFEVILIETGSVEIEHHERTNKEYAF